MAKKTALGRGLDSLLPSPGESPETAGAYFLCPIDHISPNPHQPRKEFSEIGLEELAASINEKGIIQPLIVLKDKKKNNKYYLIAGERRWRASRIAGLAEVPVVVQDVSSRELLELALIENIQREDLNPLEEAFAYHKLINDFGLTQEETARRVGKERSTISNTIRLLKLPDYVKQDLAKGNLTMGHARALLSVAENDDTVKRLRDRILENGLSVRQTEDLIKQAKGSSKSTGQKRRPSVIASADCRAFANSLVDYLGSRTRIVQKGSEGKVEIFYKTTQDLERILELIIKE